VGARLDGLAERAVADVHRAQTWNQPFYGAEGDGWFLSVRCDKVRPAAVLSRDLASNLSGEKIGVATTAPSRIGPQR
jgi:hypothetical protein